MRTIRFLIVFVFLYLMNPYVFSQKEKTSSLPEKTSFQESAPWSVDYNIRTEIAMVYGIDSTFNERVEGYRKHGYNVQFTTGIAWGCYQFYFTGQWDGKPHEEEGQIQRNGSHIGHGKGIPFIVPTDNYITYFKTVIKKVVDAGITNYLS